jgi:hypothetical protein
MLCMYVCTHVRQVVNFTPRVFTSSVARPNLDAYFPAEGFIKEEMQPRVLAPMRDSSGGMARQGCKACGVNTVVLRQGARPKQPLHAYHWMHAASCQRCMGQLDEGRHNQLSHSPRYIPARGRCRLRV